MIEVGNPENPRILIVDDECEVLNSLADLLRKDFHIFATADVEEALSLLVADNTFSIVISDQRMPEITGSELLTNVARTNPNTIRILLTAYSDINAVIEAVNNGHIAQYISKPWDAVKLLATLNSLHQVKCSQLDDERRKFEMARLEAASLEADLERDKLDNIVSAIDADLLLLDQDLTILWVNRRLKERPQFSKGEIIGKLCNLSYCNVEQAPETCPALIAFKTGEPVRQEHSITHPDGSIRYYNFTCSPIKNKDGVVDRVLELVQDVTEYHAMVEALQVKNNTLERLNRLFVDREFRVKELKERVKELEEKLPI